ncbi:hypothetical protein H5410_058376 [Solanum commersonii]|uniref:Uncharacterized protein n=1 Tax=Solanum commersonii TaxID=4109 RepID=A0A9J5WRG6_SOLCO|nr:hypothetical protein H5410_058376 [Solanum commersonii]
MSSFSRLLSTISKKVVKPFSPTPSTQKIHKFSLLDQCMDLTFPPGLSWKNVPHANDGGRLSIAQLSHFDCGGMSISVCMSHKVGDARNAFSFLKDWATITRQYPNGELSCPSYHVQDSLMPSLPDGPLKFPVVVEPNAKESVEFEKMFFLSESNIRALKALIVDDPSSIVQNPTTTEVVSAIVYKCAAIVGANISNGNDSSSQMVLVSDLRKTIPPSIKSTSTIGNILTAFSTPIYNLEDLRLPKLVADIRKSKHELSTRDNFKENKWVSEMLEYANKINTRTEDDQSYR